jgi:predicted acetyltransferase
MGLELQWVGESDYPRVGQTRLRCYSGADNEEKRARYLGTMTSDPRAKPGDFLLARRDGEDVGTSTALSLKLWMRGARLACQGVAYVGTIKTARRAGASTEPGIASQMMHETIRKARERGEVVSALMPFRASYYEHFGYGLAERRCEWTIPLLIIPKSDYAGFRFYDGNVDPLHATRVLEQQRGQCEIETDLPTLRMWSGTWSDGMVVVDRPDPKGPVHSWALLIEHRDATTGTVEVSDWCADSPAAFNRIVAFLGTLKDQYSLAKITCAADVTVNRLLKETQIPHRQVDHPFAVARPYTRMQIRILDHKAVLEAMQFPAAKSGFVTVGVKETEGQVTRFRIDLSSGRASAQPHSGDVDLLTTDVLWASLVSGDLSASVAQQLGKINVADASKLRLLDVFADGPVPYCQDYF